MAKVDVEIHGKETLSTAAEKAGKSLHDLKDRVGDSIKPMKDLASGIRDILAIGGIAVIAKQVYQGLADMEAAAVRLHPELALMAGSAANFNAAITQLKGSIGVTIAEALNPLRAFFIDLIDPTFQATKALKEFSSWADVIIKQKGSKELLAQMEYTKTLNEKVEAQNVLSGAEGKQQSLISAWLAAKEKYEQPLWKSMLETGTTAQGAAALKETLKANMDVALNAVQANKETMRKAKEAIDVLTAWLEKNKAVENSPSVNKKTGEVIGKAAGKELARSFPFPYGPPSPNEMPGIGTNWTQPEERSQPNTAENERWFQEHYLSSGPMEATQGPDYSWLTDIGNQLGNSFMSLLTSVDSVRMMLDPIDTILGATFEILTPLIDLILQPLIGALVIVGRMFGAVLTPVLQILAPVIALLTNVFVDAYNFLLPVFNWVGRSFTSIANLVDMLIRPFEFLWDVLNWLGACIATLADNLLYHLFDGKWAAAPSFSSDAFTRALNPYTWTELQAIGTGDLASAGADALGSTTGSNTSVQKPADIYIYQTFQGPVIGDGGKKQVGEYCAEAIGEALGTGYRVTWLES